MNEKRLEANLAGFRVNMCSSRVIFEFQNGDAKNRETSSQLNNYLGNMMKNFMFIILGQEIQCVDNVDEVFYLLIRNDKDSQFERVYRNSAGKYAIKRLHMFYV